MATMSLQAARVGPSLAARQPARRSMVAPLRATAETTVEKPAAAAPAPAAPQASTSGSRPSVVKPHAEREQPAFPDLLGERSPIGWWWASPRPTAPPAAHRPPQQICYHPRVLGHDGGAAAGGAPPVAEAQQGLAADCTAGAERAGSTRRLSVRPSGSSGLTLSALHCLPPPSPAAVMSFNGLAPEIINGR